MSDIATRWDVAAGQGDWAVSSASQLLWTDERGAAIVDQVGRPISRQFTIGEGLAAGDDLLTAVLISLFTDAEAGNDDVSPDSGDDPRGWWGGEIGSKIWLRLRGKKLPATLALVRHDIEQALAWLITDDVAAAVKVETEWTASSLLGARVLILRNDGLRRALSFARAWENS